MAGIGRIVALGVLASTATLGGMVALAPRPAPPVARAAPGARPTPIPIAVAATVEPARPAPAEPEPPRPDPPKPEPYVVRRVIAIDHVMRHGEWHWDEAGVPDGPIVITTDLKARTLSVFRAGYEIGTAVILYGADAKPTPLGVFAISQKDADHKSNIYKGAPMPYMLRLTNDGVSIHGSDVRDGLMTHGCVGVPTAFARKLFGQAKLGDKVIVTNGEMLDVGAAITAA